MTARPTPTVTGMVTTAATGQGSTAAPYITTLPATIPAIDPPSDDRRIGFSNARTSSSARG